MGLRTSKTDKSFWENLEPFKDRWDIPDLPVMETPEETEFYNEVIVPNLIRCGAIPKKDLEVGAEYFGDTRNTDTARWDGEVFEYVRHKMGCTFTDTINHFEDDNGYAMFVPLKKIEK